MPCLSPVRAKALRGDATTPSRLRTFLFEDGVGRVDGVVELEELVVLDVARAGGRRDGCPGLVVVFAGAAGRPDGGFVVAEAVEGFAVGFVVDRERVGAADAVGKEGAAAAEDREGGDEEEAPEPGGPEEADGGVESLDGLEEGGGDDEEAGVEGAGGLDERLAGLVVGGGAPPSAAPVSQEPLSVRSRS